MPSAMEELDFEREDLGPKIKELSKAGVLLDSEEFKGWWSKVERSSCFTVDSGLDWDNWRYVIEILKYADLSRIEKMSLDWVGEAYRNGQYEYESVPREYQFGDVAVIRGSEFSALKTLVLHATVESDSLAEAWRQGVFRNLRVLSLPMCQPPSKIVELLTEGDLAHLTTLSVTLKELDRSTLDAFFQIPCLTNVPGELQGLTLRDFSGGDDWEALTHAIQLGSLSNIVDLRIIPMGALGHLALEDLVSSSEKWFSSLKSLEMPSWAMRSNQVCSLVRAVMELPITELALKRLILSDNLLGDRGISALVRLADSGKLPHLETWNLSSNHFTLNGPTLVTLVQSLPSLKIIDWLGNRIRSGAAEAIVKAYFENKNLTANIIMDWTGVRNPSLRIKLEMYRKRNLKLVILQEELGVKKPVVIGEKKPGVDKPAGKQKLGVKKLVVIGEKNPAVEDPAGEETSGFEKPAGEEKSGLEKPAGDEKARVEEPGVETLVEEKKDEDLGDLMPLTSARVFICGYAEVGKTTLREALVHLEKCPEAENAQDVDESPAVRKTPELGKRPEVRKIAEVRKSRELEKSPEVGKASLSKSLTHYFGKWGCCLRPPLPNVEPTLPNEERSLPNQEPVRQHEESGFPNEERSLANQESTQHPNEESSLPIEEPPDPSTKKPRTRGIEISRIEEKRNGQDTTLVLWDLAGQQEYHILHSAFLAGSESGKATIFVLVFKFPLKFGPNERRDVRNNLLYWLRMVAYSSLPGVKRHVMIVLNQFDGQEVLPSFQKKILEQLVAGCTKRFRELSIRAELFIINVRDPTAVQPLKHELFQKARMLLQDVAVPRIFFDLQMELKEWSEREENKGLPILTWEAFQKSKLKENRWTVKTLDSAASYLHEIGEIIYLKKTDPKEETTLTGPVYLKRSIVVPNPEWFCKNIVGELLLPPEALLEGEEQVGDLADHDGSISIPFFEIFFKDFLVEGTEVEDVISMLEQVGLCYRRGKDEIVIPALIKGDYYDAISWAGTGNEVIGRCLSSEDQEGNDAHQEQLQDDQESNHGDEGRRCFIPEALFRNLQVKLHCDPKFGGRGDSNYRVGKSYLSFNVGPLLVLVQSDVDESSPVDDRIDILVEIKKDSRELKLKAVECICEIMQKVQDLCVAVCPGLRYDIKVIEPASASKNVDQMIGRKLMSLEEIKGRIIRGEQDLNWETVGGSFVPIETCLSQVELSELVDSIKGQLSRDVRTVKDKYDECQEDMKAMGIGALEASDESSSSSRSTVDMRSKFPTSGNNDHEGLDEASQSFFRKLEDRVIGYMEKLGDRLVGHMDKKFAELHSELSEFRQKHNRLLKEIQAQRELFIAEKTSSVPRYIYLTKKQQQSSWISFKEAFYSAYELHFLCEGNFKNGHVHEVIRQEGIELPKPQAWLVEAAPWLRWSLQVAVLVGKTVGNVYLPGIFSLIPAITIPFNSDLLAKAVDRAATELRAEGIDAQPVDLDEKPIAEAVLNDLRDEMSKTDVAKKIGLVRVTFRESCEGSSNRAQHPVFWICEDCVSGYGPKVHRI